MSTPTASQGSSIYQHLRATKHILQSASFGAKIVTTLDKAEFDVIEQDAFEILYLIRSWRNRVAPISQIPPEILGLVPDFWGEDRDRDKDVIALTHVCQAWRQVFVSRSRLWTDLDCERTHKTRVYLQRSKSSPINLTLERDPHAELSPRDPFFQITPHAIGRLKSLDIHVGPWNLEDVTDHLSHPAPLLEDMRIDGGDPGLEDRPVLDSTLFNGDLPSLRVLRLASVDTELPWRSMANLTSLMLAQTPASIRQLLDFFESAPRLQEVELYSSTPTSGAEGDRLVSLACLKLMDIEHGPASALLDHVLIPVGARLKIEVDLPSSPIGGRPPKFLDNLKNLPNFTKVWLTDHGPHSRMQLTGPNGSVRMSHNTSRVDEIHFSLKSLAQFDTSEAESLAISFCEFPPDVPPHKAFLPMENLRTLSLNLRKSPQFFIYALDPSLSPSGVVVCPKLEELALDTGDHDVKDAILAMASGRALRGAKLRTFRMVNRRSHRGLIRAGLRKHVGRMEYCDLFPWVDGEED